MNVLDMLFKEVSVTQIIAEEISYKSFDFKSFLRLGSASMRHYSYNEIENLYYYLQNEIRAFRGHIYDMDVKEIEQTFNVFDVLFVFVEKVLKEEGREPVCRYKYLSEWRRMSLSLGEDLFITAYLATRDAYHSAKRSCFFWKTAISTDNVYLRRILERGIAENHFHLKGSAPAFDVSWLSLMNHMLDYSFKSKLDKIDESRLHYTVAYSLRHPEEELWIQVLQAAVIRIYLFCILDKKPFVFGNQVVDVRKITTQILYDKISDEPLASKRDVLELYAENLNRTMTFGEILNKLKCRGKETKKLNEMTMQIFKSVLINQRYSKEFFSKWSENGIDMRRLFMKTLPLLKTIQLKKVKVLLSSESYYLLCESESADYIYQLLQNPKRLAEEAENIQDMIHRIADDVRWQSGREDEEAEYSKLDYFLMPIVEEVQKLPTYKALMAGERYFLYRYLRYAYTRKKKKDKLLNFFYRYIVIKNRVWNEMIQTNGNVGFYNFLQYQGRKEEFIEDTVYDKYFLQLAVAGTMLSQNIKSLEARITPKETALENHKTIMRQNKNIRSAFFNKRDNIENPEKYMDSFFYVYHFVKEKDKSLESQEEDSMIRCRHYEKRAQVYRQSMAISNLRESYYESAKYVYGIDAATEEIVCRPEVFAQAFRYLKKHTVDVWMPKLPNLRATYHVGEDFLDILDGLRAIDEAIYYLDMRCGDRLGHALALGIDVEEWYKSKKYRVLLSRQEYMDNLAWLYGKIRKFNVLGFEDVKMYIEKEFNEIMRGVYLNNIDGEYLKAVLMNAEGKGKNPSVYSYFTIGGVNFDINSYYDAWKLRCDNPECYRQGFFENPEMKSKWDEYAINKKYPENYRIRYNPAAAFIYHCYHYVPKIKKCGNEKIEKEVPYNLIRCVAVIQKKMQELVAAKGICIECNPSSNYLIGTFHEYKKHPIRKFYNKELASDEKELNDCAQLSVSINTDDQGVFYTSLENEYALMTLALEKARDEDGNPKYNRMRIYDWINAIREMGLIQSFKSVEMENQELPQTENEEDKETRNNKDDTFKMISHI